MAEDSEDNQTNPAAPGAGGDASAAHRALLGSLDRAIWPTIEGWAADPARPQARITLQLLEGSTVIAEIVADKERADLRAAGIGDGCHAYSLLLRPNALAPGQHSLLMRCAESYALAPGFPVLIDAPALAPPHETYRWSVDLVTEHAVAGWISVIGEPARHCAVKLREGRKTLARSLAAQFRPDLLAAGIGDGSYAFSLPMPPELSDGAVHFLDVVEEESGFCLNAEKLRWQAKR